MAKNLFHLRRHPKKTKQTQNQTIFFQCRLEDLPSLLRVWTAF